MSEKGGHSHACLNETEKNDRMALIDSTTVATYLHVDDGHLADLSLAAQRRDFQADVPHAAGAHPVVHGLAV